MSKKIFSSFTGVPLTRTLLLSAVALALLAGPATAANASCKSMIESFDLAAAASGKAPNVTNVKTRSDAGPADLAKGKMHRDAGPTDLAKVKKHRDAGPDDLAKGKMHRDAGAAELAKGNEQACLAQLKLAQASFGTEEQERSN